MEKKTKTVRSSKKEKSIENRILVLNTAYLSFKKEQAEEHFDSILAVPQDKEVLYNEYRELIGIWEKKVPPLTDDGLIDGKPQEADHGKDEYRTKVFNDNIKHLENKINRTIHILGYLKGEKKLYTEKYFPTSQYSNTPIYMNTLVKIKIGQTIPKTKDVDCEDCED